MRARLSFPAAGVLLALAASGALACGPLQPAVIDIDANSYYMDKHRSVIDPVLKARNVAAVKPIDDFLDGVARAASAYHAAPATKATEAGCALQAMAGWADAGALLGKMTTRQSWYTRKWTLGGLALSYAKLKPAASALQRRSIEAWLLALAGATIAHADAHTGVRNNHYYWEGLAVSAAGAVTGDARALAWGRKVFEHAMSQVAADGSLPLEMNRATKALHYHVFAVTPLVMMASILDLRSPKLDRLVRFTLDGVADPSYIEKQAGFAQERAPGPMSWKAIYERQLFGPASVSTATSWQPRLGGDISTANPLEHVAR